MHPAAPTPFDPDLVEVYLAPHARPRRGVYTALLVALLAACVALPLVRVAVSVQARGLVRPVLDKHQVDAPTAGFVRWTLAAGARELRAGDTLLLLRGDLARERGVELRRRIAERERDVRDLERLAGADPLRIDPETLSTPRYRDELLAARAELDLAALDEARAGRELRRAAALHERGLAPRSEVDEWEARLAEARARTGASARRQRGRWGAELASVRGALSDLRTEAGRAEREGELHALLAPVAGSLEELASLSPGSFVAAGQRVAVISPRSPLVADVFVSPADIARVRPGAPVRLQVDAFPHAEWGPLPGRVTEISADFVVSGERPAFRVRVRPERTVLVRRNGARGELRKGMTLTARFPAAERSLWQLLRDDAWSWLDPREAARAAGGR